MRTRFGVYSAHISRTHRAVEDDHSRIVEPPDNIKLASKVGHAPQVRCWREGHLAQWQLQVRLCYLAGSAGAALVLTTTGTRRCRHEWRETKHATMEGRTNPRMQGRGSPAATHAI